MAQTKKTKESTITLTQDDLDFLLERSKENIIGVGEVFVSSNTEPLHKVQETIDKLIKKHQKLLTIIRERKLRAGGYFG